MKGLTYVVCLLLSLPNMLAGTALIIIRHTFATFNPLQIITDFLFQMVWGLPLAAFLFVLLLIFGILSKTRPYAAMLAFVVNAAALAFVLFRVGFPSDFDQNVVFLPIILALIGFAWIAYPCFSSRPAQKSDSFRNPQ